MNQAPVSVLLIALTVVTIFPLLTLFGYHIRLILLNLTTVEQVRTSKLPSNHETNRCVDLSSCPLFLSHRFESRRPNPTIHLLIHLLKIRILNLQLVVD